MELVYLCITFAVVLIIILVNTKGPSDTQQTTELKDKGELFQDQAHPEAGLFDTIFARQKIKQNTRTQLAANEGTNAVKEGVEAQTGLKGALFEQRELDNAQRRKVEKDELLHRTEMVELQSEQLIIEARNELIRLAQLQGMDIVTYLKVTESRNLKQIDLEAYAAEYQIDQENISRVQQEKLELIDRASGRLYSMYDKRKKLERSRDRAKDDKLRHLNYLIEKAEVLIRAEQDRYLEVTLGQEAPRSLPAYEGEGRDTDSEGESQEPKRGRGRPRGSRNRRTDQ